MIHMREKGWRILRYLLFYDLTRGNNNISRKYAFVKFADYRFRIEKILEQEFKKSSEHDE